MLSLNFQVDQSLFLTIRTKLKIEIYYFTVIIFFFFEGDPAWGAFRRWLVIYEVSVCEVGVDDSQSANYYFCFSCNLVLWPGTYVLFNFRYLVWFFGLTSDFVIYFEWLFLCVFLCLILCYIFVWELRTL